jgi:hypothetical protein
MVSNVGASRHRRDFAPDIGHAQRAPILQSVQKIIAPLPAGWTPDSAGATAVRTKPPITS